MVRALVGGWITPTSFDSFYCVSMTCVWICADDGRFPRGVSDRSPCAAQYNTIVLTKRFGSVGLNLVTESQSHKTYHALKRLLEKY
jgi:hypothetical protein